MSEAEKPGYVFAFSADLGSGKAIQVTGNFPVAATKEFMDGELDKVSDALSRQQAKLAVIVIENQITSATSTLEGMAADYDKLNAKYSNGKPVPTNEQAHKENMESTMRQLKKKIEQLNIDLEKVKKEAK